MDFVSRSELEANMSTLTAAPKNNVPIDCICVRPDFSERHVLDKVYLSRSEGVVGDRWKRITWIYLENGESDPRIQVSLTNSRILKFISKAQQAITLTGDNFVADIDCSEANMPVGQRLKLGEAVIEVSDVYNDACKKFAVRYGGEVMEWIRDPAYRHLRLRGIFARIVQSGWVTEHDRIQKC